MAIHSLSAVAILLLVGLLETDAWLDTLALLPALETVSDLLLIELDSVFATALDVTSFSVMADETGISLLVCSDISVYSDEATSLRLSDWLLGVSLLVGAILFPQLANVKDMATITIPIFKFFIMVLPFPPVLYIFLNYLAILSFISAGTAGFRG